MTLNQISQEIRQMLEGFPSDDRIIFNHRLLDINLENFNSIPESKLPQKLAFIDGGQAEIIYGGNFCLSFIRVFAQVFLGNQKLDFHQKEFYLFTKARWIKGGLKEELFYQGKIFPVLGEKPVKEEDLLISSYDSTITSGVERAPLSRITSLARRLAELSLAAEVQEQADFVLLDGTLEKTFTNEERYLSKLSQRVSALAKSCSLFTVSGNSPVVLLNKLSPGGCWSYFLEDKTYFVKLHPKAKHVFRFEGNPEMLPLLLENSRDALFLGYPYGLILADKFARVSNEERNSLRMNFLLKAENRGIVEYLNAANAHDILDCLG